MANAIQSVNLPLEISQDNGVTWKSLICLEGFNLTNTSPTNDADTQCGRFIGVGIEGSEITGTAVLAMYPTAGQLTYRDITLLQFNITRIKYRVQYPSSGSIGDYLYQTQFGFLTVTSIVNATGQVVKFGFTIKSDGARFLTVGT